MMSARSISRTLVFACVCFATLDAKAQENSPAADRLEEEIEVTPSTAPAAAPAEGDGATSSTATESTETETSPAEASSQAEQAKESTEVPVSDALNLDAAMPQVSPTEAQTGPTEPPASTSSATTLPSTSVEKAPDAPSEMTSESETVAPSPVTLPTDVSEDSVPSAELTTEKAVNYALSYSLDWTYVIASAGLRASGVWDRIRPPNTWIGPNFQENESSLNILQEPRLFGAYNQPMLQEKVSVSSLVATGAIAVALATSIDGALLQDGHRAHVLGLGALVTTLFAADMTEAFKIGVGRLRPDFAERYQRAACQGIVDAPTGLDCAPFSDGFILDEKDYLDGFKSFPSGHASTSFALATYLSLWLNRTWVFGKYANAISQPLAVLASGLLYSGAFFSAASRVADHRHHLEDVAVGAALGTGIGAATWLLYFDLDGEARQRSWSVLPQTYGDGGGLALTGSF